jgi:hypothetical protein
MEHYTLQCLKKILLSSFVEVENIDEEKVYRNLEEKMILLNKMVSKKGKKNKRREKDKIPIT